MSNGSHFLRLILAADTREPSNDAMACSTNTIRIDPDDALAALHFPAPSAGRAELHGKPAPEPRAEFGEAIMYVPLKGSESRKLKGEPRSYPGHYLGMNLRTGEHIIGTSQGVIKARDVWRIAVDERWNRSRLMTVKGFPWKPVPTTPGDRIPISIDHRGRPQLEEEPNDEEEADLAEVIPFVDEGAGPLRDFMITAEDIKAHG